MDESKKIELNDDQLDAVNGGAKLDAWFESGRVGVPYCSEPHVLSGINLGKIPMNSYWKDGAIYVECPFCMVPKKLD